MSHRIAKGTDLGEVEFALGDEVRLHNKNWGWWIMSKKGQAGGDRILDSLLNAFTGVNTGAPMFTLMANCSLPIKHRYLFMIADIYGVDV